MKTIHYMGLGVLAVLGLVLVTSGPTPRPDINPGKLADIGDII
jgi:hypothetical protein